MPLEPGTKLGSYEILTPLASGYGGEAYKASDTKLNRTVVVKVLPSRISESSETNGRFEREARTITSLSHPNICAPYDVAHHDGVDYFVTEYVEGETLAQRLTRGPLSV